MSAGPTSHSFVSQHLKLNYVDSANNSVQTANRLFFDGRDCIQMSLAIFCDNVSFSINQNLRIVDR